MLEAAYEYASRGWPIFPCRPGTKEPMVAGGVYAATTNPDRIEEWWTKWPEANIGLNCGMAGFVVIDLDPGHDPADLAPYDLPATHLRSRTPRGGEHLFYRLLDDKEELPGTASKIAPHIDTRSHASYVVLPPSKVDGKPYEWTSQGKAPQRSQKLADALIKGRQKSPDASDWSILGEENIDLPENVERYRRWLKYDAQPAIEGRGGDHATYSAAAMGHSLGLSAATCHEALLNHYNNRCSPPWDSDEMMEKVEHAYTYAKSPPGNCTDVYQRNKTRRAFEEITPKPLETKDISEDGFYNLDEIEGLQPPTWLVKDAIPESAVVLLHGERGSFKSFLALDLAMSIAANAADLWEPVRSGAVLYLAGEGVRGFKNRLAAWHKKSDHTPTEPNNFLLYPRVPLVRDGWAAWAEDIATPALQRRPDGFALIVIDTLARSLRGMNENAQEDAGQLMQYAEQFGRLLGSPDQPAAVLLLHHSNAQGKARGSGVFEADADTVFEAARDQTYLTLRNTKQKDGAEWEAPRLFEAKSHANSLALYKATEKPRPQTQPNQGYLVTLQAIQKAFAENPNWQGSNADLRELLCERYSLPEKTFNAHWKALVQPEAPLHGHRSRRRWYANPDATIHEPGRSQAVEPATIQDAVAEFLAEHPDQTYSHAALAKELEPIADVTEQSLRKRYLPALANRSPFYGRKSGWQYAP